MNDDHAHDHLDRQARVTLSRPFAGLSPISLALAYTDWALHLWSSPGSQSRLARKAMQQAVEWSTDAFVNASKTLGQQTSPPSAVNTEQNKPLAEDERFADPSWMLSPWREWAMANKAWEQWWLDASGLRGMQAHSRDQMRFYGLKMLDTLSPSNWLLTNPQALQKAWATGGLSLLNGLGQWLEELDTDDGAQAEGDQPRPGQGMAMTPGEVVMRNHLVELIQYHPTTPTVHERPVLIIPSCIMKYYILDLTPRNSLVQWLTSQGHTVYIVSWRNPDASDALLSMDDYVRNGVLDCVDWVREATSQPLHLMGYCLGGTFAAIAAAALCQDNSLALASLTLLAAEVDFSEPGEMGVLLDESQVSLLEDLMADQGFLTGQQMAGSFQFLRSRELVWSSRTRRWLLGEDDIGNDLMTWNADVTRLPAVMHSEYLRRCFLNNELANGRYQFEGRVISLRDIRIPVFAVGTVKDHVAPWKSVYKIHRLVLGPVTFALTNGGHNAGIVSEPGHPRRHFQLKTTQPADNALPPDAWTELAQKHEGSWWTAWDAWLVQQGSGHQVHARVPRHDPSLGPAPGRYVMVRYGD